MQQRNFHYRIEPCDEEDAYYLEEQLRLEDDTHARPRRGVTDEDVVLKVTNDYDVIIAGCTAKIDSWGVAAIDVVWVDKPYRRQGMGTALLAEAERLAAAKGCYLALVGVFDFQASAFFEARGYELFNIWEGYPAGHDNYSLAKRLDKRASKAATPRWIATGEDEDAEYIDYLLNDYNESRVPHAHDYLPLDLGAVDAEGNLIAGCLAGSCGWNATFVELLWVQPAHRRKGVGTALLNAIEREARESGSTLVLMGAYDWQVDFLVHRGYTVTGELKDCPKGHVYYSLMKRL